MFAPRGPALRFTADLLLLYYYCFTATLLLLYCFFITMALLLLYCYFTAGVCAGARARGMLAAFLLLY